MLAEAGGCASAIAEGHAMSHVTVPLNPGALGAPFRAIHGVNNGPFAMDGLLDTSELFKRARIPEARLHDPLYPGRNVVDINAVFPDPAADPENPASYDFVRTDHYLQNIAATGATTTYRLGYTIDHHACKRYCLAPDSFEKWAAICRGIARHYNGGWANGFANLVARWEIWNEPDLATTADAPSTTSTTWRGSWQDYFRLYHLTATAIKQALPQACVGGPAITGGGIRSGFLADFLAYARGHESPLDFISWHTYTHDTASIVRDTREVRRLLDAAQYQRVQSLLTEWHFTPQDADWCMIMTPSTYLKKQQLGADMTGDRCAAFTAATLLLLQDEPLDMAHFYNGDSMFFFGLFDALGAPHKPYYALLLFSQLLDCTHRLALPTNIPEGLHAAAGMLPDGRIRVLLVNNRLDYARIQLHLPGDRPVATADCKILSGQHNLAAWPFDGDFCNVPSWSLALIDLPAAGGA